MLSDFLCLDNVPMFIVTRVFISMFPQTVFMKVSCFNLSVNLSFRPVFNTPLFKKNLSYFSQLLYQLQTLKLLHVHYIQISNKLLSR